MLKFGRIMRLVGGILAWLVLVAASFGAGIGIAYLFHLLLD